MTATAAAKGELNAAARQIARVAAGLFATQGYEATSVRMIVEAAGVAKPTLYYHFGSKEGLAQALLTVPMRVLADAMRSILEARGDPVEALVADRRGALRVLPRGPGPGAVLLRPGVRAAGFGADGGDQARRCGRCLSC